MAGKRMKLDLNMPIFKYELVHQPTLVSWGNAIESTDALVRGLRNAWAELLPPAPVTIKMDNTRFVQSLVELNEEILGGTYIDLRVFKGHEFRIESMTQNELMQMTVLDVAQGQATAGLRIMMILGTWRAMVQKLSGPIPGNNFNISVAGIAGTCMLCQVPIEL